MAEHYEVIIYTASLSKYADPLLDILDPEKVKSAFLRTASISYAIVDFEQKTVYFAVLQLISKRLFRENCVYYDGESLLSLPRYLRSIPLTGGYLITGHYVKDLSLLNRDITQTIIVDNSPMSYIFHPGIVI